MSKVIARYGASANIQNQNGTRSVDIKVKTISVGTSNDSLIKYDSSVIGTLTRSSAKRYGKVVVFSFVFTNSSQIPLNTTLFTIDSSIAPSDQTDCVGANYSSADLAVYPTRLSISTSNSTTTIFSFDTLKAGNVRGEMVWLIKGDD